MLSSIQAKCAHWINSGKFIIGTTNYFFIVTEACSTGVVLYPA